MDEQEMGKTNRSQSNLNQLQAQQSAEKGPLSGTLKMKRYNSALRRELEMEHAVNYHEPLGLKNRDLD